MPFKGPNIKKLNGGLRRSNPSDDSVMAIIFGGVAVTGAVQLNTAYRLLSTEDAESIGITAAYDANNDVLVHYHISEFFRLAPDAELYIMLQTKGTTQTATNDKTTGKLRTLIYSQVAARKIKYAGVVLNPASGYTPTITDNIDADVLTAIPKAQELVDDLFNNQIYLDGILLEGRSFGAVLNTAHDLRTKNSGNVSVCISADPEVTALDASYAGHASVGAALGMLAARQVNENLGSVDILNKPDAERGNESYPLSDGILWNAATLSGGTDVSTLTNTQITDLTTKGYIFAGTYEGYAGIFFNSSPTCTAASSDYAFIENNRVWNKSARIIRTTLIPRMKSTIKKNPVTGFMKPTSASGLKAVVDAALKKQLVDKNECSGAEIFINPQQIVNDQNPLQLSAKVVMDDIIHDMDVEIGLTTQY